MGNFAHHLSSLPYNVAPIFEKPPKPRIGLDQATNSIPQVRAGTIKVYAVTDKVRLAVAPDIPTVDEAGCRGFMFRFGMRSGCPGARGRRLSQSSMPPSWTLWLMPTCANASPISARKSRRMRTRARKRFMLTTRRD
jgi:hypothetical protein